eukprot:gene11267-16963_t
MQQHGRQPLSTLLLLLAHPRFVSGGEGTILAWHITDPHVDPFYTKGTPTEECYCRSHALCPERPSSASCTPAATAPDGNNGLFGNAEADCETPTNLFTSSLQYAASVKAAADFVIFTGDFCAYMMETPCESSATGLEPGSSRAGLLNCIAAGYTAVRAAFPHSLVLPSLGNHDTVVMEYDGGQSSAAVFTGSKEMAWLYTAVADLWAKPEATGCTADVHTRKGAQTAAAAASSSPSPSSYSNNFSCAEVRRTLLIGGYFATRRSYPKLNMTTISLNTNYWSLDSNVALRNVSSEAYMLGDGMLEWAKGHLAAAAVRGDKVMVLGHIPPYSGMWCPGFYRRWITILEPYYRAEMMLPHFFGHMHTDEWQIVRSCSDDNNSPLPPPPPVQPSAPAAASASAPWLPSRVPLLLPPSPPPPPPPPPPSVRWKKTTGIKWCSGKDLQLGFDPFGQGFDGEGTYCPWLPPGTAHTAQVEMCEAVCMLPNVTAQGCAGFTYYPPGYIAAGDRGTCCFRSNTANKPADPLSPVECYEKDGGPPSPHAECSGQPLGVMLTGPSLSYAFPAANPTIRLVEFSSADLSLLDMSTYTADLHAANIEKKVEWELEYSFVKTFGLNASGGGGGGMSPAALAGLVERMAQPDSAEWELYRGKENGTLFCRGWLADDGKADSHCEQPCTGSCKTSWINVMNGTGANTPPTRQPHSKAAASMLMLHHPPPLPLPLPLPLLLPLPAAAAAAARMTRTAPVLTPHTFAVNGSTVRCNSSWGHATTHAAQPENTRTRNAAAVLDAFYPSCDGASVYGPSLEADVRLHFENGIGNDTAKQGKSYDASAVKADAGAGERVVHLVRTVSNVSGPFAAYNSSGQPPSGANAYIEATYTDFNPRYQKAYEQRMKPFSATPAAARATDPPAHAHAPAAAAVTSRDGSGDRLRMVIRTNQSVTEATLPEPAVQQLQQVVTVCLINEECDETTSRSYCQISLNIKTHISGVHAYNRTSDATAFNDGGQGGLVVIVGPINSYGRTTQFSNPKGGRYDAWTSWGAGTRASGFNLTKFQVEVTWSQFQQLLVGVTEEDGDPSAVYGPRWNSTDAWVLLRAGYGQENYNRGTTTSVLEGLFQSLEVLSVA